jgi:transposase
VRILVLARRKFPIPNPYLVEFRGEVVAVARKGKAPLSQIAKDFGFSDASLHNWLARADVEDGLELREAKKRIHTLEQEAEVMRRAVAYLYPKRLTCWSLTLLLQMPALGSLSR